MPEDPITFLSSFYPRSLRFLFGPTGDLYLQAKTAAWGQALADWLAGFTNERTRDTYRQSVSALLSYCRKLPWEVRQADVSRWLEEGMPGKAGKTRRNWLIEAGYFYRFACGKTWITPTGRRLRLCRANPVEGVERPPYKQVPHTTPLSETDLRRLLAAFDRETPWGRRDYAIIQILLETGMQLRAILALRLKDVASRLEEAGALGPAWQALREHLEAGGRLAQMEPDDFLFTALNAEAGEKSGPRSEDGRKRPLKPHTMLVIFKHYVKWAGLKPERVTLSTLRYTGARRLLEAGAETARVAVFLGLKDSKWTQQVINSLKAEPESAAQGPETPGKPGDQSAVPPQPFQRRKAGAQPGHKNNLKHGLYSSRYRLKHLGLHRRRLEGLSVAEIDRLIDEVSRMLGEFWGLPEEALDLAGSMEKSNKVSYFIYTIGMLKAAKIKAMKRRQQGIE